MKKLFLWRTIVKRSIFTIRKKRFLITPLISHTLLLFKHLRTTLGCYGSATVSDLVMVGRLWTGHVEGAWEAPQLRGTGCGVGPQHPPGLRREEWDLGTEGNEILMEITKQLHLRLPACLAWSVEDIPGYASLDRVLPSEDEWGQSLSAYSWHGDAVPEQRGHPRKRSKGRQRRGHHLR